MNAAEATAADATLSALLADQQDRWQRGERIMVESYLARTPVLRGSRDNLLDLIYHEILLRERRGEKPALDDYLKRFPDLADDLRLQFEVHAGLADTKPKRKRLPTIPGCTVLKRLGRGGMGVVYKARQDRLGRDVAVKVIRDWATADPIDLARFRSEAEAVARVNHPNVVQIHEVGERKGCPYLILEYVSGGSLDRLLRGRPLAARPAAELILTLARAVDHLHQQGIVHCDLKPANVLLAPAADGVNLAASPAAPERYTPKVADFGFARKFQEDVSRSGQTAGTPLYMAPEQAGGPTRRIGPATDVHALGAILYELLVGHPPYLGKDVLDVFRQIQFHDPVSPRRLQPSVPRDLETVCLKCLHKDPARRYPTAAALADDLERFLTGRPVSARPVSAGERTWRWAQRNPWVAGLTAALVAAVVVGFVAVTAKMLEARQERNEKEQARQGEKDRADELGVALHDLEAVAHRMRVVAADRELRDGNVAGANRILDECRPDLRSFDWFHLKQLGRGSRMTVRAGLRFADRVTVSPDGKRLAVAGAEVIAERTFAKDLEQKVFLADAQTGDILRKLPGGTGGVSCPTGLAFSPDGKRLAVAQADRTIRVWNVDTGESVWSATLERNAFDLTFLSDTELLVAGERWIDPKTPAEKFRIIAEFQVRDAATGRAIRTVAGGSLTAANYGTLSRNGRRFAAWSSFPHDLNSAPPVPVCVFDTATGELVREIAAHTSQVQSVALGPDGAIVAVADRHAVRIHSVADGRLRATLRPPAGTYAIAFDPTGRLLAAAGADRIVRMWDADTGQEQGVFRGHEDAVSCIHFSPDGSGFVSSGHDGTARLWDAAPPGFSTHRNWPGQVTAVAADRNGRVLAVSQPESRTIRLLDPIGGKPPRVIKAVATHLAVSPDGTSLAGSSPPAVRALAQGECGTRIWDAGSAREERFLSGVVGPLAFTADGRSVVGVRARVVNKTLLNPDGDLQRTEVVVCDRNTGDERFTLSGHSSPVKHVAVLPDGKHLATADGEEVIVWDLDGRAVQHRFKVSHRWDLGAMAYRPDGKQLATAGSIDRTVVVRDPSTGTARYTLSLTANATALAYSPDSRLLAAGCDDNTVRIWDAESGQLLLTLTEARQSIRTLTFAGSNWLVAGAGGNGPSGEVITWDGRPR